MTEQRDLITLPAEIEVLEKVTVKSDRRVPFPESIKEKTRVQNDHIWWQHEQDAQRVVISNKPLEGSDFETYPRPTKIYDSGEIRPHKNLDKTIRTRFIENTTAYYLIFPEQLTEATKSAYLLFSDQLEQFDLYLQSDQDTSNTQDFTVPKFGPW